MIIYPQGRKESMELRDFWDKEKAGISMVTARNIDWTEGVLGRRLARDFVSRERKISCILSETCFIQGDD